MAFNIEKKQFSATDYTLSLCLKLYDDSSNQAVEMIRDAKFDAIAVDICEGDRDSRHSALYAVNILVLKGSLIPASGNVIHTWACCVVRQGCSTNLMFWPPATFVPHSFGYMKEFVGCLTLRRSRLARTWQKEV